MRICGLAHETHYEVITHIIFFQKKRYYHEYHDDDDQFMVNQNSVSTVYIIPASVSFIFIFITFLLLNVHECVSC